MCGWRRRRVQEEAAARRVGEESESVTSSACDEQRPCRRCIQRGTEEAEICAAEVNLPCWQHPWLCKFRTWHRRRKHVDADDAEAHARRGMTAPARCFACPSFPRAASLLTPSHPAQITQVEHVPRPQKYRTRAIEVPLLPLCAPLRAARY
eukprot:2966063-Rhodomonas_salina.1